MLIRNGDDERHRLTVVFKVGEKTIFDTQYDLAPGEKTQPPDVVEAGRYRVRATLETAERESMNFQMQECTDNSLSVYIKGNGEIDLRIATTCD